MNRDIHSIGLDVGTSKVRCVIGEPAEGGKMNIIGFGEAESRGLRRGIVTTTEAVADSIKRAVAEAERVSGLEVQMATVNLSGEHFRGENKSGVVAVAGVGTGNHRRRCRTRRRIGECDAASCRLGNRQSFAAGIYY